jgi:hypothetical protein
MQASAWKGDPPRELTRCAFVYADRVRDPGDRADPQDCSDDAASPVCSSPSGPRQNTADCSRRGPGRSVGKWRKRSGSAGIGPAGRSDPAHPSSLARPDEDITIDAPKCPKTCDNPERSSLCLEDRGSSNRGLGGATPGPHLLLATVGQEPVLTPSRPTARMPRHARRQRVGATRRGLACGQARGVRPWVLDPWIREIRRRAEARRSDQFPAKRSENVTST